MLIGGVIEDQIDDDADAAFRYYGYVQAGDSERAAAQKARMDEAAKEVGIYEPELAKIESALNRE